MSSLISNMKIIGTFLMLFFFNSCFSQEAVQLLNYDHKTLIESTLIVYAENGSISLTVIKPNLIKVGYQLSTQSLDINNVKPQREFIRVTQNLENIYLLTDSLLIVVSKLDFSVKFLDRREKPYITNQSVSFTNNGGLNLLFSKNQDELFYNSQNKKLKSKEYSLKKIKSISSSKDYELSFDKSLTGNVDLRNPSVLNLTFDKSASFGYFFKVD